MILDEVDGNLWRRDVLRELCSELISQLLDGQAARLDATDQGKIDKPIWINAKRFVRDVVEIHNVEADLIAGAEDVLGDGGWLTGDQRFLGAEWRKTASQQNQSREATRWVE